MSSSVMLLQTKRNHIQPRRSTFFKTGSIVIDGPHYAGYLPAAALNYRISDPLNNIVYGVHPFPKGKLAQPISWPELFSDFCTLKQGGPLCQVTAWNIYFMGPNTAQNPTPRPQGACPYRAEDAVQEAMHANSEQLFAAAKAMNSGMYGWAYDYPNVILRAGTREPVNMFNYHECADTPLPWGGGEMLHTHFHMAQ